MLVIGIIMLLLGYLLGISILYTVGVILVVVGLVLMLLGGVGHPIGGRRHWW